MPVLSCAVMMMLTRLSQLSSFTNDFGGLSTDKSIGCNDSVLKTAAVKTYPLSF